MANSITHREVLEEFKHFGVDDTGFISDDFEFSNQAIVRQLQKARAVVLSDALMRGDQINEHSIQVFPCVRLCEADRNECPCAPASGCYWLKSVEPIPNTINIVSVSDILSKRLFNFIKWSHFKYVAHSRIPSLKKAAYYTIRDSGEGTYLYIYNDRFLEDIAISAIFEDPMKAAAYPKCGVQDLNAVCYPLDVDFHTDARYRDLILKMAWQSILGVRRGVGVDIFNDDIGLKAGRQPVNTT